MQTDRSKTEQYQHPPVEHSTLQNADWSALRLLNHYRLFLLVAFAAVFYLTDGTTLLGQHDFALFKYTHLAYLFLALTASMTIAMEKPGLETQFYLQAYLDIIILSILMYASGGIQSGLGILLVFQIAVIGHCTKGRYATLFAAITTAVILSQELYTRFAYGAELADFPQTALVSVSVFFVAFLTSVVLPARINTKSADNRPLNVKQIAELNSEIIQELESGVLYVDKNNHIQLINDTAREMVDLAGTALPMHLGLTCEPLYNAMRDWHKNPTSGNRPLVTPVTQQELLPCFTRLDDGGTLIKLEDHRVIMQQVQQLKLASLGRLSASIAHEIRNPLGAISNAVQLLGESSRLSDDDNRLITIAENHTHRINRIIEDVMSLSSRQQAHSELLDVHEVFTRFKERFIEQNELPVDTLTINDIQPMGIIFDPVHFDQVLWNICDNSIKHSHSDELEIQVNCSYDGNSSVQIDILDNGRGIDFTEQNNVFEPFFTTAHDGTGLGLFIIKELCELNHASISYVDTGVGACFRITLPIAHQMAA